MQKAVSTYVYVKERLHPGLLDGLVRGGAQAVEIFAARQHVDYANRKQHVRELADWFRSTGIPLNSVHSPLYGDYEFGLFGPRRVKELELVWSADGTVAAVIFLSNDPDEVAAQAGSEAPQAH